MPNRPKPTALKILEGNRGKRPINTAEPHPTRGMPTLPRWLRDFPTAVKEWRREAKELDQMGVLTIADSGVLAMRAYVSSQIQELAAEIGKEGRVVEIKGIDKDGNVEVLTTRTNPKCVQLAKLLSEHRALGSELGLGPSSRTRIKVEPQKPASKFTGLIGGKTRGQR